MSAPVIAPALRPGYWRDTPLEQMTSAEWEALCDGCGKCCLVKIEDADNPGDVYYTNVACSLLDSENCRCGDYPNRKQRVPDCVLLNLETLADSAPWLPFSCAYRRLYEGRDLPAWHPLLTGDPQTVHLAWVSVQGRVLSETDVTPEDWERHLFNWDDWAMDHARSVGEAYDDPDYWRDIAAALRAEETSL